jgi:hypothetical protein
MRRDDSAAIVASERRNPPFCHRQEEIAMEKKELMMVAMAEKCGQLIQESKLINTSLAPTLQPPHLLWMCSQIQKHVEHWSEVKLHRWLGFIQAGMVAHGMIDLPSAKTMFNEAKVAYADASEDWLEHLDHESAYRVDIGGQG